MRVLHSENLTRFLVTSSSVSDSVCVVSGWDVSETDSSSTETDSSFAVDDDESSDSNNKTSSKPAREIQQYVLSKFLLRKKHSSKFI